MYSDFTKNKIIDFVTLHGNEIVNNITNTGLYFSAVVAQLSVESKWGTSYLSSKYGNYGGIKATGSIHSSGQTTLDTTEVIKGKERGIKDSFATYTSFENFLKDYVRVLKLPQYINAGVYTATTPEDQILAIGKGGYSTRNPQAYLNLCRGRIEACIDLYKWGKIDSNAVVPAEMAKPGLLWENNQFKKSIDWVMNKIGGK